MGHADLVVFSANNKIEVVVEVKTQTEATDLWAAELRRNLLVHSAVPDAQFFLLVMPEYLYLWHNKSGQEAIPADYKISTEEVLQPYTKDWQLDELQESNLELLVKTWLNDLVHSDLNEQATPKRMHWLFDSGLYQNIKQGHVEREFVV